MCKEENRSETVDTEGLCRLSGRGCRKIRQDGFSIVKDKPINYGQQIAVQFCEAKASVNIYNGKKGLTHVYNGDSALKQRLMLVLEGVQNASEELQPAAAGATVSNGLWAGSDESGKGDFFGSLVVAATVVDNTTAAKLQAAGVKDCKLLTDKKSLSWRMLSRQPLLIIVCWS